MGGERKRERKKEKSTPEICGRETMKQRKVEGEKWKMEIGRYSYFILINFRCCVVHVAANLDYEHVQQSEY